MISFTMAKDNGATHCMTKEPYNPKNCDGYLHEHAVFLDELHKKPIRNAIEMQQTSTENLPTKLTDFFLPTKTVGFLQKEMNLVNDEQHCSQENLDSCSKTMKS
jgi:hypothetical protein